MTLRLARFVGAFLLIGLAVPAVAGSTPKAVVELFTSQGCSSCPPADQLLAELAGRPDIIALTLHVDYWDYLGWKDTLAQPAFTARQRAYASARNDKQVYTPQIVINGLKPIVGSDRAKIDGYIAKTVNSEGLPVAIALREAGFTVTVEIAASPDAALSGEAWLLPVAKLREVAIGRGENKDRTITYANVVRGLMKLGDWSGRPARFDISLDQALPGDADGYVVLVQTIADAKPGAILGAAKGPGL